MLMLLRLASTPTVYLATARKKIAGLVGCLKLHGLVGGTPTTAGIIFLLQIKFATK